MFKFFTVRASRPHGRSVFGPIVTALTQVRVYMVIQAEVCRPEWSDASRETEAGIYKIQLKSLIMAQTERWRHG